MKRVSVILLFLSILLIAGRYTSDVNDNQDIRFGRIGERYYFAKPSGTGGCTSWADACSFRDAVALLDSSYMDVIYVGGGTHDLDNGSDATGTTITTDFTKVVGVCNTHAFCSVILNADAAATHVLQVTGDYFTLENMLVAQMDVADEDVTHLYITGKFINISYVEVRGAYGSTAGIGLQLVDNLGIGLSNVNFINMETIGIELNNVKDLEADYLHIRDCAIGIETSGDTEDSGLLFEDIYFHECTTAISIGANSTDVIFYRPVFVHNTDDVSDSSAYHELHVSSPKIMNPSPAILPANAGITVNGHNDAWSQGTLTQLIAADVITSPFIITGVNLQNATATNTYKLELFFGEATGDISLGIYEFTVGTDFKGAFTPVNLSLAGGIIPANSYVGAKVASSTGGTDNVVITVSYQTL